MTVVYPAFRIQPEHRERYRTAAEELVVESLKEPGVISYGVFESIDDANLFVHVEVYDDQEAFDDHVASPHVQAFLEELNASRLPNPEIHVFHISEADQIHID